MDNCIQSTRSNSVCFIVPYFGIFPSTFPYWLNCCRNNPTFHWIILTDDRKGYQYPGNVKVIYTNLENLRNRFERILGFRTALEKPYKLCDFKPLYGDLFSDELAGFSHWGYCDVDLLFGHLDRFFTDQSLEKYDKISVLGHISVLRNKKDVNVCYKKCNYEKILKNIKNRTFDEVRFYPNINRLLMQSGYSVLETIPYADIGYPFRFHLTSYQGGNRCIYLPYCPTIFRYINKSLIQVSFKNGEINEKEISYVHFQKRKISVEDKILSDFLLVPNRIIEDKKLNSGDMILYSTDNPVYTFTKRMEKIKRAIKNRI